MAHKKDGTPQLQRGGRPVGAATRLTRKRANEISTSGKSPLDVMYTNMIYWFERAVDLNEQVRQLLVGEPDVSQTAQAAALFDQMIIARDNAQRCAIDAAPYVHPKLQAIATQTVQSPVISVDVIIPRGTAGEDRTYREGYGAKT